MGFFSLKSITGSEGLNLGGVAEDIGGAVVGGLEGIGNAATGALSSIGDAMAAIVDDPKKLALLALSVYAPGAGSALGSALGLTGATATVVGNAALTAALNGGDVKSALLSAAIPVVGKEAAAGLADQFVSQGFDKAVADTAGKLVAQTGLAAATGRDPLQALTFGGVQAALPAVTSRIEGFDQLSPQLQASINRAVGTSLLGGDPSAALIDSALAAGRDVYNANTRTVQFDDGSSLIFDNDGNLIRSTESTDTPGGDSGFSRLMSGLGGAAKTGLGGAQAIAGMLGSGQQTAAGVNPALAAASAQPDLSQILAVLGANAQQNAAPVQAEPADVKSFEEQGYGDLFGGDLKLAGTGKHDDLLKILRG